MGCRQNFLTEPPALIQPNLPMDADMGAAAVDFVEKLRKLGGFHPM